MLTVEGGRCIWVHAIDVSRENSWKREIPPKQESHGRWRAKEVSAPEALMSMSASDYRLFYFFCHLGYNRNGRCLWLSASHAWIVRKSEPGCCLSNWCRKQGLITEEIMAPLGKVRSYLFPPHKYDDVDSSWHHTHITFTKHHVSLILWARWWQPVVGRYWELAVGTIGSFIQVSEGLCISDEGIVIVSVFKFFLVPETLPGEWTPD